MSFKVQNNTSSTSAGIFSLLVILFILAVIGYMAYFYVWVNTTSDGQEVRAELNSQWSQAESQRRNAEAAETQAEAARIQAEALDRLSRQQNKETPEKNGN